MNNNVFTIIALHSHGYTVQELAELYKCYSIETIEDIIKKYSDDAYLSRPLILAKPGCYAYPSKARLLRRPKEITTVLPFK